VGECGGGGASRRPTLTLETIHELHRKKLDGVLLLKIDFEKAYDKVKWCKWIQEFISHGSVGIRVNEDIGHYFQTRKGL
jgi:hypothetical protein